MVQKCCAKSVAGWCCVKGQDLAASLEFISVTRTSGSQETVESEDLEDIAFILRSYYLKLFS